MSTILQNKKWLAGIVTISTILILFVVFLAIFFTKKDKENVEGETTPDIPSETEPDVPSEIGSPIKLDNLIAGKTKPVRIFMIGDSTVQGFGPQSTDFKVTCWPSQFAEMAALKLDKTFNINNCVGALFGNLANNDSRINFSGWNADGNGGTGYFGMGGAPYTTTSSSPFTFQPSSIIDTIEIYIPVTSVLLNVQIGSITYSLTTPDLTKSNAVVNVYIINLPTSSIGTPLISVTSSDPTQKALLSGIIAYSSTDDVSIINCGVGGSKTFDWCDTSYAANFSAVLECYQPDLIIQNLCINNYLYAETLFNTDLQFLDDLYLRLNVPVIYYSPNACSESVFTRSIQDSHIKVLKDLCISRSRQYIDIYTLTRSSDYMISQGWMASSDLVHPTPQGYGFIASRILAAMT